ncbi:MAG: NAD-dependent malic enzyme [Gammaproteobacteria bacterium]|nr:NAD-dependent malic enzyme [Gammaproteobacteria bacterium]
MNDNDLSTLHRGVKILHDPIRNKGTAFTEADRRALKLTGLLPPRVHSPAEQELRVLGNIRSKPTDLSRYLYLISLQDRNETLFYRIVMNNIVEMMPLIYTPTVGAACQEFQHIFRRPRGFYVSSNDRGKIKENLKNWPHKDARIIVITDGERILGLGDLGADGMGIPIGKLSLYTACAGIHPAQCLPIMFDVGTNNESLLNDPLYNGLEQRRLRGEEYDELLDEFMEAAQETFPGVLIQFEDFGNINAFRLLDKYRDNVKCFNDDIQGTGAVALSGILGAMRITGGKLSEQRLLFLGAGEAGIGTADSFVAALVEEGIPQDEARKQCWFVDTQGMLTSNREQIAPHKKRYARDLTPIDDFLEAVKTLKPTAILGLSGQPGSFPKEVIEAMAAINKRPIIFALSNPTSKAECTAQEAYRWSKGRAIFASGSPFEEVKYGNKTHVPGQGNNVYIFPGVGLGAIVSGSRKVTSEMFLAASHSLANQVSEADLAMGCVYPSLKRVREVSAKIAFEVACIAWSQGLTDLEEPEDIMAEIHKLMYQPVYPHYA